MFSLRNWSTLAAGTGAAGMAGSEFAKKGVEWQRGASSRTEERSNKLSLSNCEGVSTWTEKSRFNNGPRACVIQSQKCMIKGESGN